MKAKTVNIYVLVDPRDNEIRYVGFASKSLEVRLRDHISKALKSKTNTHKEAWIRLLIRMDLMPKIVLIQTVDVNYWAEAEKYWITYFLSLECDLTNATLGGEGVLGLKRTEEQIARIKERIKGRILSPEHKSKISEGLRREHQSGEHKAKISQKLKGRVCSEEHKRNVSLAKKGRPLPEKQKQMLSEMMKGDTRNRGRKHSEVSKQNMSVGHTGKAWTQLQREAHKDSGKKGSETRKIKGITITVETRKKMWQTKNLNKKIRQNGHPIDLQIATKIEEEKL